MELRVLAELENSWDLTPIPTIYDSGIWRYCLYATGEILPFMKDTYTRKTILVSNIIVNNIEYSLFDTFEELRAHDIDKGGWVNHRNIIYVKYPYFNPPFIYYSQKYGILLGFTNNSPILYNERMYRSGLLSAPVIEQGSDVFTYDRMKFNSATVRIENTNGQFDNIDKFFGNEFNILVDVSDDPAKPDFLKIAQYYIANIINGYKETSFILKDKRERLSAKIPNQRFTEELYPNEFRFFDDGIKDKEMQEVYGHCFGVPGVCLQSKQIYASGGSGALLMQYRYRFSSKITRVDRIRVKMTSGPVAAPGGQPGQTVNVDGWTTVYQRELPPGEVGSTPDHWEQPGWKPYMDVGDISHELLEKGEISLSWNVAKQGGKRENGINDVRIDGLFINKSTSLDKIIDIMSKYSHVPFNNSRYDISEINSELSFLSQDAGIMFDKEVSVYEAIEQLQGGYVAGFLFQLHNDRFTVRLDNPNRQINTSIQEIKHNEITNIEDIEIDWNAELYGTYTDIEYRHDYGENSGRHLVDRSMRDEILDLHRLDKVWKANSLLVDIDDVKKRSDLMLEEFKELRPIIRNISLFGKKWFKLRVYDIFYIDLRIPEEDFEKHERLINLIELVGDGRTIEIGKTDELISLINKKPKVREFAGRVRCQLLKMESDTQTGETIIEVRVRKESEVWHRL